MIEILQYIIGTIFLAGMVRIVWESSVVLDERKKRLQAGTHDYYDNPIKKK